MKHKILTLAKYVHNIKTFTRDEDAAKFSCLSSLTNFAVNQSLLLTNVDEGYITEKLALVIVTKR